METRAKQEHRPAGPDGIVRSPEVESELNRDIAAAFATPPGRKLMDYLRSITLNRVLGPEATDAHLRHHEGMRTLVAILEVRTRLGADVMRSMTAKPEEGKSN
jgi:hypothetical protein